MYILGLAVKPTEMASFPDFESFKASILPLSRANPGCTIFSFYIPDVSRVFLTGIKGKIDSICVYTTSLEAEVQRDKYLRFYSPQEVFFFSLGAEATDV